MSTYTIVPQGRRRMRWRRVHVGGDRALNRWLLHCVGRVDWSWGKERREGMAGKAAAIGSALSLQLGLDFAVKSTGFSQGKKKG